MKKIAVIITTIIYLFLSTGVRINAHYCGDRISSVDFFFDQTKSCCGDDALAKKCCKDKVSYIKLSDNQNFSPVFSFSAPDFSEALVPLVDYSRFYLFSKQELPVYTISFFDSDTPLGKNPIYIVNRSFRV
ncbi:MAG TPA: hypothetical protein VK750_10085 [Cytophagaceae bacterium]|nr:hypothetical protein [Cytophagaceae bacterium]